MALPGASPVNYDVEAACLKVAKEKDDRASYDAATGEEHSVTVTDYTAYSTKGLYGIIQVSVREHPGRGTKTEIQLGRSGIEPLVDLVVAIVLLFLAYYSYKLLAAPCTCSNARLPTMNI